MPKHEGPVCKQCGFKFYYDYLDKPEPHEGSGLCWHCWSDRELEELYANSRPVSNGRQGGVE